MKSKKQPVKITRHTWKTEAEDEIIRLLEDIDTIGLSEDNLQEVEKYIERFKIRLIEAIDTFKITAEIALENESLTEDILDEIYFGHAVASEYEIERMKDIVESENKGSFVRAESLAEQIKLDEFINELNENPYQLKLIA